MVLDNLEVRHKAFGDGVVIATKGQYITVKFAAAEKIFVYPDIFEKHLTLRDGTVSEEIKLDLAEKMRQKQRISDEKREENYRAMTRGIVIPGKDINIDGDDEENKNSQEEESEI
ncbi:MAG: hypothetical protein IJW66_01830 [Clostridia bacterium]|nr:hypothetical protein [Clostridia bacterium]